VTSAFQPSEFFSELEAKDLEWTCAGGFATETQTFYNFTEDGKFVMLQVIHASVGVWFPTIQFITHIYDLKTKERIWNSVNVSNFAAAKGDKRSCKADEFSITYNGTSSDSFAESYTITARPSKDLQVSVVVSRPHGVPSFKLGKGPKGGFSYFGKDLQKPEGYVVHRFWPRTRASGSIVYKGRAIHIDGPGILVHAIQGMRPNLVASRWNFAHFQSEEQGGISAIQMEFTSTKNFGPKGSGSGGVVVNVGVVTIGGKVATVTGETILPGETPSEDAAVQSRARHLDPQHDKDTGYNQPTRLAYIWRGNSVSPEIAGQVSANLEVEVGTPQAPIGLVDKVDVLGEVPSVVKGVVNAVVGVKPYIYQWANPVKLNVHAKGFLPDGAEEVTVEGWLNNEASFIS